MATQKDFDKKEAIFAATLELVSKHGFHSSPMSEVAKQANVAAGTIYHYFKSKDDLICALYVRLKEKTTETLLKQDDANKHYRERIRSFYLQNFRYFTQNPKEFYFLEQFSNSPFIQAIPRQDLQRLDQPIYDFLRKAVFMQAVRDIPPKIMISMLLGSVGSLVKLQLSGDFQLTSSDIEQAFFACWDGIKRQ